MKTYSLFKPFISRPLSSTPSSITPPKFNTQKFTHHLLALFSTLSRTPNDPTTLKHLDTILTHSHLLDPTTSLLLLRGLSLTRKLTRSKSILSSLHQRNTIPTFFLYSLLLQCILPYGTISDAEAAWAELDRPVDLSDFVLYMCRHCRNVAEIEEIYLRISSSSWRALSYRAYVTLVGAPNPYLGRRVLNDMIEKGMEADDLSYFSLFSSFCHVGNAMEADLVLRDWRSRREFEPDVSVYGHFFYGLCKSGKFREAHKLFDKMTMRSRTSQVAVNCGSEIKPGRRVIFQLTYPGIISELMASEAYFRSLCSAGRVDEAEKLLKVMMKKRTVPEVCVYSCFIKALFKVGRVDDALRFFEVERKKGYVSSRDLASSVIYGLCENGNVDDGYKLVREMTSKGFIPTACIWNWIIRSYWEFGREANAIHLFDEMRAGRCDGCGTRPNSDTYGIMVSKFLEKGEIDKGISILDEMERMKFKGTADLYGGVVRGLYKCGRVEESREWMNQMTENGVLASYEEWEGLYESMIMEGDGGDGIGELWKSIEANCIVAREEEKRRMKGRSK